mgnify:FL=1
MDNFDYYKIKKNGEPLFNNVGKDPYLNNGHRGLPKADPLGRPYVISVSRIMEELMHAVVSRWRARDLIFTIKDWVPIQVGHDTTKESCIAVKAMHVYETTRNGIESCGNILATGIDKDWLIGQDFEGVRIRRSDQLGYGHRESKLEFTSTHVTQFKKKQRNTRNYKMTTGVTKKAIDIFERYMHPIDNEQVLGDHSKLIRDVRHRVSEDRRNINQDLDRLINWEPVRQVIEQSLPQIYDQARKYVTDNHYYQIQLQRLKDLEERVIDQEIHESVVFGTWLSGNYGDADVPREYLPEYGYEVFLHTDEDAVRFGKPCSVRFYDVGTSYIRHYDRVPITLRSAVGMLKLVEDDSFVKNVGFRVNARHFFIAKEVGENERSDG